MSFRNTPDATQAAPPDGNATAKTDILSSIFVLGLGFAAGMQLGKIAPLIGRMQEEMGFSLTFAGWLASVLGLFVALAAYPAARLIARIGTAQSLMASALVMVAGAVALGLSQSSATLMVSRGIEAAGYVVLVIAAPSYLANHSPPHRRGVLLALWGSFVPIGYALANLQAGLLPDRWPIAWILTTFALPTAIFLLLVGLASSKKTPPNDAAAVGRPPVPLAGWALAVAFGLYVYLSIGFFTFLPEYLKAASSGGAVSAAAVALCVPLGNFATATMLAGDRADRARTLALCGFVTAAIAAGVLYSSPKVDMLAMPIFAFAGGVAASSIFAQVPRIAGTEAVATSFVGAIAQFGGIATLLGPPLAGFLAETYGWTALGWSLFGVAMTGAALCLIAAREQRLQ